MYEAFVFDESRINRYGKSVCVFFQKAHTLEGLANLVSGLAGKMPVGSWEIRDPTGRVIVEG